MRTAMSGGSYSSGLHKGSAGGNALQQGRGVQLGLCTWEAVLFPTAFDALSGLAAAKLRLEQKSL